jgi:diguanylate cyclase (GGDEF)-like protein
LPGLLESEALDRVFNAWRRAARRDRLMSKAAATNMRAFAEAFNAALTGEDGGSLPDACSQMLDDDMDPATVVRLATSLVEIVIDEVGTDSGATVRSLVTTHGDVCALLSSQMVAAEATLARRDVLTALENDRAYDEALDEELERSAAGGRPLALAVLDLDGFKEVNDTHGHEAGNQYLRAFAAALRAAIPEGARAYRFGGDEFAVIFVGPAVHVAVDSLGGLAASNDAVPFSWGLAVFPADGSTAAELKDRADSAMYAMKEGGRNASSQAAATMSLRKRLQDLLGWTPGGDR